MGLYSGRSGDARGRHGSRGPHDPRQPPPLRRFRGQRLRSGLSRGRASALIQGLCAILLLALAALPAAAQSPSLRLAVFHTGLGRDGPGLLLRDLRRAAKGEGAADILAARDALVALRPDAVLLLDIDHDRDGLALAAFARLLAEAGWPLPHAFAPRPNTGMATGLDLDGDGRRGEADDAQGWGRFTGAGGMALLSRLPIRATEDFSAFLWRDLPGARIPRVNGQPYPSEAVFDLQRLSSTGHWRITLDTPLGPVALLAWHAGPPVFGGPHGRNRARNADENAFWLWHLETDPPDIPFVLLGDSNLDPAAGEGERRVMADLLTHPRLQDPAPQTPLATGGPPTPATGYWPDGPGALRVDYLLPSRDFRVLNTGLVWPHPEARHALVWADLTLAE